LPTIYNEEGGQQKDVAHPTLVLSTSD